MKELCTSLKQGFAYFQLYPAMLTALCQLSALPVWISINFRQMRFCAPQTEMAICACIVWHFPNACSSPL